MDYFDSFDCKVQCEDYFCGIPYNDDDQYFFEDCSDESYGAYFDTDLATMLDEI